MLPLVLICLALAAPFEDVEHRFHLNLPAQWTFAPQPGDSGGATFHRDHDGVFANASVRVFPFEVAEPLDVLANHVAAASDQEPGFRLILRKEERVAGYPSLHRRYLTLVNGDPRLPKMVDQHILMVGRTGYVIHGESLADAFPTFEQDLAALTHSFRPGTAGGAEPAPRPRLTRSTLLGHWHGNGHSLSLSSGGTITLDGRAGHFKLEEGTLLATFGRETKVFQIDMRQEGLELTGDVFATGQIFARGRSKPHKPTGGTRI